jgi:Ser/Thr protein kinase RdoA (MazF antagonist)
VKEELLLKEIVPKALELWDVNPKKISLPLQSENTVFKIEDSNGNNFALRISKEGRHHLNEFTSEYLWMSHLADIGLKVPKTVLSIEREAFVEIENTLSTKKVYACLLSWLEGQQLSSLLPVMKKEDVKNTYKSLGGVIAKLHTAAIDWNAPKEFSRPSFDVDGLLGEEPLWGRFWEVKSINSSDRMDLNLIKDKLRIVLEGFDQDSNLFGIVHADLHSENILLHNENLAIIDFDNLAFGWFGFDLAGALWDRIDVSANGGHFKTAQESIIEGYLQARPDAQEIIDSIPMFLLVRTLMLISWIDDQPASSYKHHIPKLINASKVQARNLNLVT